MHREYRGQKKIPCPGKRNSGTCAHLSGTKYVMYLVRAARCQRSDVSLRVGGGLNETLKNRIGRGILGGG